MSITFIIECSMYFRNCFPPKYNNKALIRFISLMSDAIKNISNVSIHSSQVEAIDVDVMSITNCSGVLKFNEYCTVAVLFFSSPI